MPVLTPAGGGGGGERVGSAKFGRPCLRMHCASARSASLDPLDDGPAVLPGSSFAHARCAERNAGAVVSMSDGIFGRRPSAGGSGKFVTPCERRHFTYVSAAVSPAAPVPVSPAEAHAPSTSATATPTSQVMSL